MHGILGQMVSFVILTPRIGGYSCTFPVGGRNVLKPEDITGGEICKDVVR